MKTGDCVVLKSNLIVGKNYGGITLYPRMFEVIKDRICTIEAINAKGDCMVKKTSYVYNKEMFEFYDEDGEEYSYFEEYCEDCDEPLEDCYCDD